MYYWFRMLPLLQNETAMDVCNTYTKQGNWCENVISRPFLKLFESCMGPNNEQNQMKTKFMDTGEILCELQTAPENHTDDKCAQRRHLTISSGNTKSNEQGKEGVRATHHSSEGVANEYHCRPHMCETCGKRFTLLENLNRHQMIHTDERPFICNYCKKRFRLAQHLKEHIRIHTGEKPYKCNTCGRAFCQISNLKSHQKTHTKIKAFKCDTCEKSFRRSFTLKQHKLTHTRHSHTGVVSSKVPSNASPTMSGHPLITRKRSAPAMISTELNEEDKSRTNSHVKLSPCKIPPLLRKESVQGNEYAFAQPRSVKTPRRQTKSPDREQPNKNRNSSMLAYSLVKQEATGLITQQQQAETTSSPVYSYFPSLSALLSKHDVGKREGPSPVENSEQYYKYSGIDHRMIRQYNSSLSFFHSSTNSRETATANPEQERPMDSDDSSTNSNQIQSRPVSEYSCVQCSMRFPDETELRIHVLNLHSRKDKRCDSAYSSHSDKSLPSSPNGRQNPVTSPKKPSQHAQDSKEVGSKREIDATVMKRVRELAHQALMQKTIPTKIRDLGEVQSESLDHYNTKISSLSGSENEKSMNGDQQYDCPVVGHSPTEIGCAVTEDTSGINSICDAYSKHKCAKREAKTSHKWKRQLCKAWYEFPTPVRQAVNEGVVQQSGNEDKHTSTTEAQDTHGVEEKTGKRNLEQENDHSQSFPDIVKKEQDPTTSNAYSVQYPDLSLPRFTPIVEWKPVVTGWKDMVHGTLYAVPPHLAQPIVSPYQQAVTPPFSLPYIRSTISANSLISTPQTDDNTPENRTSGNQENCTGNFFRFSPNYIQSHGFNNGHSNTTSPDNSNSPSGVSSVYGNTYWPSEPLPLSGYSRLQHGLLYQWDPNRIRLDGTSTVPSSAKFVSAN